MKLKKKVLITLGVISAVGVGFVLGNDKCRRTIVENTKKGVKSVGGWFKKNNNNAAGENQAQKPQQPQAKNENKGGYYEKPRYNNNQK